MTFIDAAFQQHNRRTRSYRAFSTWRRHQTKRGSTSPDNRRQLIPWYLPSKSHADVLIVIDTQQQIQQRHYAQCSASMVGANHDGVFPTWCLIDCILTTWLGTTGWAPQVLPRRRIWVFSQLSLSTTRVSCIAIATTTYNTLSIAIKIRPDKQFFEIRRVNPDGNH